MNTDVAPPATQASSTTELLQSEVVAIWREVLRKEVAGVEADFFDAGGNSMLLIAMLELVHKRFDCEIQSDDLAEGVTVGRVAELVQRGVVRA